MTEGNAPARLENLKLLAKDLLKDIEDMEADVIEADVEIAEKLRFARGELAALEIKVSDKQAQHRQLEASIASLEQRKAAIAKLLNVA